MSRYFNFVQTFIFIAIFSNAICQNEDRQWYFHASPNAILMDFNFDTIRVVEKNHYLNDFALSPSNICDSNGQLQFLTNNYNIYDSAFALVTNNSEIDDYTAPLTIGGMSFLDFPNSNIVVCIRTKFEEKGPFPPYTDNYIQSKVYLSYIDKYANGGKGKLIEDKKLITIIDDTLNLPVGACRHANGRDWWVVVRKFRSNIFYLVLVTPLGYSVKQEFIGPSLPLVYGQGGKAMFSNDGKTFVFGVSLGNSFDVPPWYFDVFDFDRCNGRLSNQRNVNISDPFAARVQGVAISPNNRFLYVSLTRKLYQYDLWSSNLDSSAVFIDTSASNTFMGDIKLAPNGKMYISALWLSQYLSSIEFPDSAGISCGFRRNSIDLGNPNIANYYFPNLPCFTLGADTTAFGCDTISTVGLDIINDVKSNIILFPNPVKETLYISFEQTNSQLDKVSHAIIYDEIGSVLLRQDFNVNENRFDFEDMFSIDVNSLNSGIYFINFLNKNNKVIATSKFIKAE
jgi:hypothetical protein